MQSGGGRGRFGCGDHDLLDVIGGDWGRGGVAPNHALVHLHQVLLLLHSKTTTAAKSLRPVRPPAVYTPPPPPPPVLLLRRSLFPSAVAFEQAAGEKVETGEGGFRLGFWRR
jgi:hypothetical protein